MSKLTRLFLTLLLAACGAPKPLLTADTVQPHRIVSLDYCADQYVLKFTDPDRILALSPDAGKGFSFMRNAAADIPTVRPIAEDVLLLKPDLVVRSYGGGPNAGSFFERAGVPVLDVGWAADFPAVLENTQRMADGLGAHERGVAVVAETAARLAALKQNASGKAALYMTPTGVTSGPGSLVHEILLAAGLTNYQTEAGWRSLPLERLAFSQPDIIAASFFTAGSNHIDAWSPMNHPIARAQLTKHKVVPLEGSWTACNGWFLVEAADALAKGAAE